MMPLKTQKLTKRSSKEKTREAIGADISMLQKENRPKKQAIAIALETARRKAGASKVTRRKKK